MDREKDKQIGRILSVCHGFWPHSELSEDVRSSWVAMLGDLPIESVIAAINFLAMSGAEHRPSPGKVRAQVAESELGRIPTPEDAWSEVIAAVRRWGHDPTGPTTVDDRGNVIPGKSMLKWSCPEIERVVKDIGWRHLCTGDLQKVREQFYWTYKGVRERVIREAMIDPVASGELRRSIMSGKVKSIPDMLEARLKQAV